MTINKERLKELIEDCISTIHNNIPEGIADYLIARRNEWLKEGAK